jgi:hypothetical protein
LLTTLGSNSFKINKLSPQKQVLLYIFLLSRYQKWSWLNTHIGDAAIKKTFQQQQKSHPSLLSRKFNFYPFVFIFSRCLYKKFNKQLPPPTPHTSLIMFSRNWSWITTTHNKICWISLEFTHAVQNAGLFLFLEPLTSIPLWCNSSPFPHFCLFVFPHFSLGPFRLRTFTACFEYHALSTRSLDHPIKFCLCRPYTLLLSYYSRTTICLERFSKTIRKGRGRPLRFFILLVFDYVCIIFPIHRIWFEFHV